jgi:hypothetical protein
MTRIVRIVAVAVALFASSTAFAAPTQCMTDQAKKDFIDGVNLAANTYKLALITSASSAGTATTTWAGISANEVGASGSYSAGGATLAGRSSAIASNHACVTFTTPVTFTTATITARAAVIYNSTSGNVIGIYCLDGGSCAADTTSTGGTFTINLNAAGSYCVN